MRKSIAEQVDLILKANGAKGIGHLDRFQRCRILALGEPRSRTHANKLLRAWIDGFADRAKRQRGEEGGDGIEAVE